MSNKNSLKYQFNKQLVISIGLLVIIFSFLLDRIFSAGIDASMHRAMFSMANHYAKQVESNPDFVLPKMGEYSVVVGKQNLPRRIQALFPIETLDDYSFSVNSDANLIKMFKPERLSFLVVYPLKNNSKRLYLFYNNLPKKSMLPKRLDAQMPLHPPRKERLLAPPHPDGRAFPPPLRERNGAPPGNVSGYDFERENIEKRREARPQKRPELNVPISIAFIILLAILLIFGVIQRLINSVLKPLNELAIMAKSVDEKNPDLSFEIMKNKTEIGEVAKTLNQTMNRIHQYHQREKQFLQNASHELRTPIAVVGSALDIIDLRTSQGKTNIADQHMNIRRANKNMAELTEALLFLNRKSSRDVSCNALNLQQLSATLINEHKYLINGKDVQVELVDTECIDYQLPTALCRIVLSNLIRNAFEHTRAGIVKVEVSELTVVITNSNSGATKKVNISSGQGDTHSHGFGIGLDIVGKIVEQQDWQFELSSDPQKGSKVVVCFDKKEA